MKSLLTALLLSIFYNCYSQVGGQSFAKQIDTSIYVRRECLDCPAKYDTVIYKLLSCGLYHGSNGDIAFKTSILVDENGIWEETYNNRTCGGFDELKNVVDTSSFKFLNTFYWKDTRHVYYIFYTSDGAMVCVAENIDNKTFAPFGESCYGADKKHIYFRSTILKDADRNTFKASPDSECMASDKNGWYFYENKLTDEEIRSRGLSK
jgi:hypothetical protein